MIGIRLSSAIRLDFLRALFSQSIHVLDSLPPGAATSTITTTSNTLQLGISEKLGVFVEYNATIVASIIIAFTRSWQLTLVTSSAILFIMITVSVLLPHIIKGNGRMTKVSETSIPSLRSAGLTMYSLMPNQLLLQVKQWQVCELSWLVVLSLASLASTPSLSWKRSSTLNL